MISFFINALNEGKSNYSETHRSILEFRTDLPTIPVVHCCSGILNPVTWFEVCNFIMHFFRKHPMEQCIKVPVYKFYSNELVSEINFYARHFIPAYLMDVALRICGRKPM